MARVVVIDNYDSFTFNLVQYLGELGAACDVVKNDETTPEAILDSQPNGLLISPGPCTPNEAGISLKSIETISGKLPILGVCLGHQAIGQSFGGKVVRSENLMHGRTSEIVHDGKTIFEAIESPFVATRYHSLIVERASVPKCLIVSAWTAEGEIMALRHESLDVEGVQFHPESILTLAGKTLLGNGWRIRDQISWM